MDKVKELVDTYIATKSWGEAVRLAKAQQKILLSEPALQEMRERIEQRRAAPDEPGPKLEMLERSLSFLENARSQGIGTAYWFLLKELNPSRYQVMERVLAYAPQYSHALDELLETTLEPGFDPQTFMKNRHRDFPYIGELSTEIMDAIRRPDSVDVIVDLFEKYSQVDTWRESQDMPRRSRAFEGINLDLARLESPAINIMSLIELGRSLLGISTEDRNLSTERAIENFRAALITLPRSRYPLTWATVMNDLGQAYQERLAGDQAENIKQAIECHIAALEVFTRRAYPKQWAETQYLLGHAYMELGNTKEAISSFKSALQAVDRQVDTKLWALLQKMIGGTYSDLTGIWQNRGLKRSIKHYHQALQGSLRETDQEEWAEIQNLLGASYQALVRAGKKRFQHSALTAFRNAVDATPPEIFPYDRLMYLINLSLAQEEAGHWADTHASLKAARAMQRTIIELASGEASRLTLIADESKREIYWRDAEAILHLPSPDLTEVAIALEEGRAQAQRAVLDMDTIDLLENAGPASHERFQAFIDAREGWRKVQRAMDQPLPPERPITEESAFREQLHRQLRDAREIFERARDAIRELDQKPDFLSPLPTWQGISQAITVPDEALVYLVTGLHSGGMALIITQDQCIERLELPAFTAQAIIELHQTLAPHPLNKRPFFCGGLAHAQGGKAFLYLRLWAWNGSARDALQRLPPTCGFARAVQKLAQQWRYDPKYSLLDTPFTQLSDDEQADLANSFTATLLSVEIETARRQLSVLGIGEVASALEGRGIHKVAIVPYWILSLFPLSAVPIKKSTEGKERCFGDLFEVTLVPSARALEISKRRKMSEVAKRRSLILAVGNPQPLPYEGNELRFAEAEVDTTRRIAEARGLSVQCLVREEAQRDIVVAKLSEAKIAHLAMHGQYLSDDPLQSKLIVAGDKTVPEKKRIITLEQCLKGEIDLVGMQLLILSACESSLVDIRNVANEALGMASAFLQAGAASVIASLWALNDHATYLLMSRFINLYLNPARNWSPAHCLAEAQRWLREEATNKVIQRIQDPTLLIPEPELKGDRSLGFSQEEALDVIRIRAGSARDPEALPYKDPYFWAAFTVTGG